MKTETRKETPQSCTDCKNQRTPGSEPPRKPCLAPGTGKTGAPGSRPNFTSKFAGER